MSLYDGIGLNLDSKQETGELFQSFLAMLCEYSKLSLVERLAVANVNHGTSLILKIDK